LDDQEPEGGGPALASIFADEDTAVEEFFAPRVRARRADAPDDSVERAKERPAHYKVISISLYTEDIERLEELVTALRARGHSRANKSMVIREALRQIDLDLVPARR
jgi:hypothetical protein